MSAFRVAALVRSTSLRAFTRLRPPARRVVNCPPAARALVCDGARRPPQPPIGPVAGENPKLHMVFTCGKCDTRAVKSFTKKAYNEGVVIVTCPGCGARHVIADNLGWFGEEKNIEQILAKKGARVAKFTDKDLDYVPDSETPRNFNK